jgi:ABC-type Fe3+/spermidine/putrescine transport system ATPase subunit
MDEPLGALDLKLREFMQLEIRRIQQRLRITTIYVTHDQAEALAMSDRVAVMNNGEILQVGSPWEIYANPADRFVAEFVGQMNFLEGTVVNSDMVRCLNGLSVGIPHVSSCYIGKGVIIGLRPEDLTLQVSLEAEQPAPHLWYGRVERRKYIGNLIYYFVQLDSGQCLIVETKGNVQHLPDNVDVWIKYSPLRLIIWEKDGERIIPEQESGH